jgi:hypothetical protein
MIHLVAHVEKVGCVVLILWMVEKMVGFQEVNFGFILKVEIF